MEAYNGMDIEKAGSMLEEALRVAHDGGVMGPLLAQTNLNLGIVYVGGLSDNDGGVKYFMDAICADPSVQLDPLTSTPDVQSVFQVAGQRVQQMGCPQGGPMLGPGAAAQTMPMQGGVPQGYYAAAPSGDNGEQELPPGWAATDTSEGSAKEFARGFLQVGLTLGLAHVGPGMLADRKPPYEQVFISRFDGGYVGDLFDPQTGNVITNAEGQPNWNFDDLRFPGTEIMVPDAMGNDVGTKSANAWVPDGDSTDGVYEVDPKSSAEMPLKHYLPLDGECAADGKKTGPGQRLLDANAELAPSRYCVRVKKPGFASALALRAAAGYFVTRRVSLAVITRFQFAAGEGDFAHLLLGARVEYMFTKPKARGLMISGFLGGTFGQIQAQPSTADATGKEPWIKSGLQGAHIGANVRYRFTPNFAAYMAPEFDVQFPTFLWNIDFSFLGAEVAF